MCRGEAGFFHLRQPPPVHSVVGRGRARRTGGDGMLPASDSDRRHLRHRLSWTSHNALHLLQAHRAGEFPKCVIVRSPKGRWVAKGTTSQRAGCVDRPPVYFAGRAPVFWRWPPRVGRAECARRNPGPSPIDGHQRANCTTGTTAVAPAPPTSDRPSRRSTDRLPGGMAVIAPGHHGGNSNSFTSNSCRLSAPVA